MSDSARSARSPILIAAAITLVVTLARLVCELVGAPAFLANRQGGGSLIGIAWLPFLFGPWFALRIRSEVAGTVALLKRLIPMLLAYGLLARIPVVLVTVPAILGGWGTHYDHFPFEGGFWAKIGVTLLAQLVFWAIVWTVVVGTLSGWLATLFSKAAPAASPEGS